MNRVQVTGAVLVAVGTTAMLVWGLDSWFVRLVAVAGLGVALWLLGVHAGEKPSKVEPKGRKLPLLMMYPSGTKNAVGNPHWYSIRYEDVPESVIRDIRSRLDTYDVDYY